jgi:hypothetical protein
MTEPAKVECPGCGLHFVPGAEAAVIAPPLAENARPESVRRNDERKAAEAFNRRNSSRYFRDVREGTSNDT